MRTRAGLDARSLDPNNPVEIVKRGKHPDSHLPSPSGNQYALLDYTVVRLLPNWLWTVLGSAAAIAIIAVIVYAFLA